MTGGGNAKRASSGVGPIFILRQFRLGNGLVLMGYLFTHLANYAFELWCLEVLEAVREVFVDFWRFLPTTILLYGAMIVHILAAAKSVMARERMKCIFRLESLQLGSGLLAP
jgi:adenylate cyclase